jgi:hypothetical protein
MKQSQRNGNQFAPARRPYRSPRLKEYGDIRAVTKAGSPVGRGDGAMAGSSKSVKL